MTTGQASSDLDQLLATSSEVDLVDSDVLIAARANILSEAHASTARAARMVRLRRRHRRLTTGIAAAAAVGVAAVTVVSAGHSGDPGSPFADPRPHPATPVQRAPVEPRFTTVAQVVNAAATASASLDPADSPYWKVVTSWDCTNDPTADRQRRPSGFPCQTTMWTGNGRPGVREDIDGENLEIPQGTVDIDGRTITWKQANSQTWTDAEVASMVGDNYAGDKDGRAPSGYYVFKNAIGVLVYEPASSAIRRQLWHHLAQVPGVTFDGRGSDALGRSGWQLTWGSPGWGSESIIIDTSTGMPLEERDQSAGMKTSNVTTIVSVGPADDVPAVPNATDLRRKALARARACGVIPESTMPRPFQPLTGRMPAPTRKQHSCLDSGDDTFAPID